MSTTRKAKLVILISGSGSNLQAFIDQCADGRLNADIACVISNRPGVLGIERARHAGITAEEINHKKFDSRETFDETLAARVESYSPDLIILAGFMRILTPAFVARFAGRMMNIHPSLLPKYPGLHTHQRAIDAGDAQAGATVHFVTPELDGGPPIVQASIEISTGETADTLANKVLEQEHRIYPLAARWFIDGELQLKDGSAYLKGERLAANGVSVDPEML